MVEQLDESVGALMAKLDELDLTERTLVIFTFDNGGLPQVRSRTATFNLSLRAGKNPLGGRQGL